MTTNSIRQAAHPTKRDARPAAIFPVGHQPAIDHGEAAEDLSPAGPSGSLADRVAYSVAEAALITGLSRDLLYGQMRVGNLSYLKVGRRRIITRRNLEAFLDSVAS